MNILVEGKNYKASAAWVTPTGANVTVVYESSVTDEKMPHAKIQVKREFEGGILIYEIEKERITQRSKGGLIVEAGNTGNHSRIVIAVFGYPANEEVKISGNDREVSLTEIENAFPQLGVRSVADGTGSLSYVKDTLLSALLGG